jgi:5-methylcytosine-specific restriction protein A
MQGLFWRPASSAKVSVGSEVEMAIDDVTDPVAVRRALEEFRALGQPGFLEKYGFGSSRGWMLRGEDGHEYDAKAVLGAAHGFQHPARGPLTADQFHGGEPTARRLRAMGFTVTEPSATRNPVWSRDELILALDLYVRHRPTFPDDRHPDVIELSGLLNRVAALSGVSRVANFRNPNGVAMKLQNFRRLDPDQHGKGLSGGGRGEEAVWSAFFHNHNRLRDTATAIRAAVSGPSTLELSNEPEEGEEAEEGCVLTRLHRYRERDRGIVARRKSQALRQHGALRCEACGFDFSHQYGKRGAGFIECHHTKPVSSLIAGERTKLQDLALLCANCHRIIHVSRPWLSLDQLRGLILARY